MATTASGNGIIISATAAEWAATTVPILNGQLVYESDTNLYKIGNGTSLYSDLPYTVNSSATSTASGIIRLATVDEATTQTDETIAITPYSLGQTILNLGTPESIDLTNATNLPLSTGVTGTLAAENAPALSGDVTSEAGSLVTTVNSNVANGFPRLDSNNAISNQIISNNGLIATNYAEMCALSSTGWVTGQYVDIHEYTAGAVVGGGSWKFDSDSTATVDLMTIAIHNDRTTAITGEVQTATGTGGASFIARSYGTTLQVASVLNGTIATGLVISTIGEAYDTIESGSGDTWTLNSTHHNLQSFVFGARYTGTFAQIPLPGTITITAGSQTITDDGGGYLVSGGLIVGKCSYTSTAWQFAAYVASGGAITASYNYASAAGRLIKDRSGSFYSIHDSGADPTQGNTYDVHNPFAIADLVASRNRAIVVVPCGNSAIAGNWFCKTPLISNAPSVHFEAPNYGGNGSAGVGASINFIPTYGASALDGLTLLTLNGRDYRNVSAILTAGFPGGASGIIANATFQGTIATAGDTITVDSAFAGTINVGDQISATGMYNGVSYITAIASGTATDPTTITINKSQPAITTATTFTTCSLPNYSAMKPGCFGIVINDEATLWNCTTYNFKIGAVYNCTGGHINAINCNFEGAIGTYYYINAYDYYNDGGERAGTWAAEAFGTTNAVGYAGGVTATWKRIQYPVAGSSCAYFFYQFVDDGSSRTEGCGGIEGAFRDCSFEAPCEAIMQTLPGAANAIILDNCNFDTWGDTISTTITPTPQQNLFWLGNLSRFKIIGANQGGSGYRFTASSAGGANYTTYSLQATVAPSSAAEIDIYAFNPSQLNFYYNNAMLGRRLNRSPDVASYTDLGVYRALGYSANLLKNSEIASNWSCDGYATAPTISAYASSGLASVTIPETIQPFLPIAPNVIEMVTTGGGQFFLNFENTDFGTNPFWIRFFIYQPTSPVSFNLNFFTNEGQQALEGLNYISQSAGAFTEYLMCGRSLTDWGISGTPSYIGILFTGATTAYVIGLSAGLGEVGPYNPFNTPSTPTGLTIGTAGNSQTLMMDANNNLIIGSIVDGDTSYSTPTTGTTVVIPENSKTHIVNPSATLAALTVQLPATPTTQSGDSFRLWVIFNAAVTELTVTEGSGTTLGGASIPADAVIGAKLEFVYSQTLEQWIHVISQ